MCTGTGFIQVAGGATFNPLMYNVYGSRSAGSTYTAGAFKARQVSIGISITGAGSTASTLAVNGATVAQAAYSGSGALTTALNTMVPVGQSYSLTLGSATAITYWNESQ
jgi:hypothetical protein